MSDTQNDQDARTLYVRGITEEIDQEILFELFQNVSTYIQILMSNLYSILIELCIKEMLDVKEFGRSEADQPMNRQQP